MVKVVMDSTCGMTVEEFEQAGITMVPLYIREGEHLYRDGIEINPRTSIAGSARASSSKVSRRIPMTSSGRSSRSWTLATKLSV